MTEKSYPRLENGVVIYGPPKEAPRREKPVAETEPRKPEKAAPRSARD